MLNKSVIKNILIASLFSIGIGLMAVEGERAKKEEHARQEKENALISFTTKAITEVIKKKVSGAEMQSISKYYDITYEAVYFFETTHYVLLNGYSGLTLCPRVLQAASTKLGDYRSYTEAQSRTLTEGFKDTPATFKISVPLFKEKPVGLEGCPGIIYNENSHSLSLNGRDLAFIVN